MAKFYITHADEHGERHQIGDVWEAPTAEHALEQMLLAAGEGDDGHYEVHPVEPFDTRTADEMSDDLGESPDY